MTNTKDITQDAFLVIIDNGVDRPLLGVGETEEAALTEADPTGEYRKEGYSVELRYVHAEHFFTVRLIKNELFFTWNDDYGVPVYDEEIQERVLAATILKKYKKPRS